MTKSRIEWTEETWNPVTGCSKVSLGCDNCYAERQALRLQKMGSRRYANGFAVTLHEDKINDPLRWRRPRLVFVNSMSDLFHPAVPNAFIVSVWATMAVASRHTFQVLTKRPQRMAEVLTDPKFGSELIYTLEEMMDNDVEGAYEALYDGPDDAHAQNVWLGTSIETDRYTFRATGLRLSPATLRFLSLEPLLGPLPSLDLTGISWVILGGESGPNHRPIKGDWVRDIRDRCLEGGVPFFFKQWGGATPKAGGSELDGEHWKQMPPIGKPEGVN